MNKFDLLKLSLSNLWRRKVRTFLTVLGVIIGTSSIVVMISLGIAMDVGFQEQLKQMGDLNMIHVFESGKPQDSMSNEKIELNDKYVSAIKKIPGVEAVMASRSTYVRVVIDKKVCDVQLVGIDPGVQEAFGLQPEEGRLLQVQDNDAILFGSSLYFYNPRSSYYEESEVNLLSDRIEMTTNLSYGERRRGGMADSGHSEREAKIYTVRGIGKLALTHDSSDYCAYTTLALVDKVIKDSRGSDNNFFGEEQSTQKYERVQVKTDSIDDVENVENTIKEMGFDTSSMMEMVRQMQQTSRRMQAVLGGIGAISLLVAGIGITNTMVMSIYERTREIGVIKVLGANLSDIRDMFLLESGAIGFAGGALGVLLSYGVSMILNHFGANFMGGYMYGGGDVGISVITLPLAAGAVGFSILIGLLAGYSPARRAMNMPVLKALRSVE